jgi:transcriptional regulator with XRE-family HTH domain
MSPGAANRSKKHVSAREVLAANIVALRHEKGWSQEALAFECGLHRTFIAHVERLARNIAVDNIERIATALGVESYQLLVPRTG